MTAGTGTITVNGKALDEYFPSELKRIVVNQPLTLTDKLSNYNFSITVKGGGISGQAEAIRLAISRALVKENEELRTVLKKEGFLTRDSRMVERKKAGRRKARRAFQWVKR
jgi:small subunit ribosomal protein S9